MWTCPQCNLLWRVLGEGQTDCTYCRVRLEWLGDTATDEVRDMLDLLRAARPFLGMAIPGSDRCIATRVDAVLDKYGVRV